MERGNTESSATVIAFPSRSDGFTYVGGKYMPGCTEFISAERLHFARGSISLVTDRVRDRLWGVVERDIMPCAFHIHRVSAACQTIGSLYAKLPRNSIAHAHIVAMIEDDEHLDSRGIANRAIVHDNAGQPVIMEIRCGMYGTHGWYLDVLDFTPALECAPGVRIITPALH